LKLGSLPFYEPVLEEFSYKGWNYNIDLSRFVYSGRRVFCSSAFAAKNSFLHRRTAAVQIKY
jgi:hypothetical protein